MELMKETPWSRIQGTKQCVQRILGDFWQWEFNGHCSRGDNCSFRHDINKRAKMTQPNPSPSSFMQQNQRNASKTRSRRGRSPSNRMFRLPCKDYLKGTCTNSFCEKWHLQNACSARPRVVADLAKSALMRIARLMNSLAKSLKIMVTKVQWPCWRSMSRTIELGNALFAVTRVTSATDLLCTTHRTHDNWVAYSRIWSRRSLHRFYGRAQTCGNRSDV